MTVFDRSGDLAGLQSSISNRSSVDTLARFKTEMSKRYEMKDMGELHFILGLQVKRDRSARTLHLSQKQYINTGLQRLW